MSLKKVLFYCVLFSNLIVQAQLEIDTDFGTNGTVNTNFLLNRLDEVNDVYVLDNESFIAVGSTGNLNNIYDFGVSKYLSSGQLDATFGNSGRLTIDYNNTQNNAYAVEVLHNGKILVMGTVKVGTNTTVALVQLNSSGKIDSTYGENGWCVFPVLNNESVFTNKMYVDTDGTVYLSGYSIGTSFTKGIVLSVLKDGVINLDFGINGKTEWGNDLGDAEFSCLGMQNTGNIIVAGSVNNGNDLDILAVSYLKNGIIDSTFANNGVFKLDFGENNSVISYEKINALTILSNNHIRLGGYVDNVSSKSWDFLCIALTPMGNLDINFAQNGILSVDKNELQNEIYDLTHDVNNNLYFTGYHKPKFNEQLKLLGKITSDGLLDENFGLNGFMIHQAANNNNTLSGASVIKLKNNNIYLGGSAFNGSNYDFSISKWKNLTITNTFNIQSAVNIYPNPFVNQFKISGLTEDGVLRLYNYNGQLLYEKLINSNGEITIQCNNLSSGVYLLRLFTPKNNQTFKIIKI